MQNQRPRIAAFWLLLAAVPAATFAVGLGWVSYWSIPRFPLYLENGPLISYDPEIGFISASNSSTTIAQSGTGTYHVYTDRRGARVSHPGEESADKLDLLFIGDSFTWGPGIANEDTFAALVARRLHLASANVALGSYGTTQTLQILRRNLDSRPRTVIYSVIADHWRRNVSACAPTYYPFCLDCSYVGLGANGSPEIRPPTSNGVRRTQLQIRYEQQGLAPSQWLIHGADVVLGRILSTMARTRASDSRLQTTAMEFLLAEMARTASAAGASLVVVFIPAGGETSGAPAQLLQLSRSIGYRFLDVTPSIRASGGGGAALYLPDGHPNKAGHALIAETIVNFVSGPK